MTLYEKSHEVDDDLKNIVRYTARKWGTQQVYEYMAAIEYGMEQLAMGQGNIKELSDITSGMCVRKCEHHYIFGVKRADRPMLILAVLHERMDLLNRVKERL